MVGTGNSFTKNKNSEKSTYISSQPESNVHDTPPPKRHDNSFAECANSEGHKESLLDELGEEKKKYTEQVKSRLSEGSVLNTSCIPPTTTEQLLPNSKKQQHQELMKILDDYLLYIRNPDNISEEVQSRVLMRTLDMYLSDLSLKKASIIKIQEGVFRDLGSRYPCITEKTLKRLLSDLVMLPQFATLKLQEVSTEVNNDAVLSQTQINKQSDLQGKLVMLSPDSLPIESNYANKEVKQRSLISQGKEGSKTKLAHKISSGFRFVRRKLSHSFASTETLDLINLIWTVILMLK